jgi:2-keto-4-pentenoate hydratase/2-oxohepta-3-ene-1,7-dioic acid hydratase in catechol pathway
LKLATISRGEGSTAALVEGGRAAAVRDLPGRDGAVDVAALIGSPLDARELAALRERLEPLDEARLLPPIPRPPKNVLFVGKNYAEHVREGAAAEGVDFVLPDAPIWFTKAHTALVGCGAEIAYDSAFTSQLDYEGELAVVIGRGGRGIRAEHALGHVFGYTIVNDVTARDQQQLHKQWFVGKSADTYAPMGPWVVTADELPDPSRLDIETKVGDEVRQTGNTSLMLFDVPALIADISSGLTLEPGDVIATGTPPGVAWGQAGRYLRPGDVVSVWIEGIGRLWNRVAAAS